MVGGKGLTKDNRLYKDAMKVLKETSRTFYIPITMLGTTLRKTVGSAYLCMRAIEGNGFGLVDNLAIFEFQDMEHTNATYPEIQKLLNYQLNRSHFHPDFN